MTQIAQPKIMSVRSDRSKASSPPEAAKLANAFKKWMFFSEPTACGFQVGSSILDALTNNNSRWGNGYASLDFTMLYIFI